MVENNHEIEAFYRLNLSTWLALDTVVAHDSAGAMKLLGGPDGKQIHLIIVRAKIGKEQTAQEVMNFLQKNSMTIPVIVIGPGKEVAGSFAHMANSLQLKTMIQGAAKALGITAQVMMTKEVPDFFPIPLHFFSLLKRPVCDVYGKDKALLFEKNKDIPPDEVKRLEKSGVDSLFVSKMDRLEFVNNVTAELMCLIPEEALSEDEQITAGDATLIVAAMKLVSLGITPETVGLAHKSMDTMKKNAKTHPKLSKLLDRMLANKASYLFTHTQLLSYIGLHIVKNIDWGNAEQEEKILFIAFFHDIALEKDEQGKIKSQLELKKSELDELDKALIDKHAQIAAELVSKFPHSPMGADQIIRQHHGTLNGVGFSEHFGNNVSPMSIVFIVAEEFTRIVLKHADGELNRTQMLRELKDQFPTSRFQKVIELLNTITF